MRRKTAHPAQRSNARARVVLAYRLCSRVIARESVASQPKSLIAASAWLPIQSSTPIKDRVDRYISSRRGAKPIASKCNNLVNYAECKDVYFV